MTELIAGEATTYKRPRGRRRLGHLLSALLLSLSLATPGVLLGTAAPAGAATAGVYIVAPKWWGWCPNVAGRYNAPTHIQVVNYTTGYSMADSGDDIGWTTVRLGQNNTIRVNVGCSLGHYSSGTPNITIRPSRNGQAIYVSPGGGWYGN